MRESPGAHDAVTTGTATPPSTDPAGVPAPAAPDDATDDASRRRSLDRTLATGVAWLGVLRWVAQALSWATTVLVARMLDADAYGIVAVASVFTSVAAYFTEHGVARVVMLRRIDDTTTQAQLHTVAIGFGALFSVALALGAPVIADVFDDPRLAGVVLLLAVTPLLSGLFGIPLARLQQRLDYARIARIELLRSVGQSATVLGFALAGAGYWSLPAGIVATHALALALTARAAWLAPARPDWARVREPLAYMRHITGGVLLWHVAVSSDRAVGGRVLTLGAMGLYQFAWNIASLPGEKITNVLQAVAAPFFGNIGDDPVALRRYLLVMTETLALVIMPVLVGFALVAPAFVPLVFGAQWRDAVVPLQVLVLYALAQNLAVLLNLVLSAAGRAGVVTATNSALALVLPPLFWFAARGAGIVGLAAVWALVQPLMLGVPLLAMRRHLALSLRAYAGTLLPPAIGCAVMTAVVLGLEAATATYPVVYRLALAVAVGALAYAATTLLLFKGRLLALREVWLAGRRTA